MKAIAAVGRVRELEERVERTELEAQRLRRHLVRIAALTRGEARVMAVSALRGEEPRPRRAT